MNLKFQRREIIWIHWNSLFLLFAFWKLGKVEKFYDFINWPKARDFFLLNNKFSWCVCVCVFTHICINWLLLGTWALFWLWLFLLRLFYETYNNWIIFVLVMTAALFIYFQFLFVLLLNLQLSIQTKIFFKLEIIASIICYLKFLSYLSSP